MLTLSILALVVSTGALALGVHSTRVANGSTGRARQQELRDQLRIVVARLPEEFLAVAVKVGIANDAGGFLRRSTACGNGWTGSRNV